MKSTFSGLICMLSEVVLTAPPCKTLWLVGQSVHLCMLAAFLEICAKSRIWVQFLGLYLGMICEMRRIGDFSVLDLAIHYLSASRPVLKNERYSKTIMQIGLIGDLFVLFSFLMTCYQTTKLLITGGQCNQDKVVILINRKVLQFVCEIKFDTKCIVLDLWNFGMHLCLNKK